MYKTSKNQTLWFRWAKTMGGMGKVKLRRLCQWLLGPGAKLRPQVALIRSFNVKRVKGAGGWEMWVWPWRTVVEVLKERERWIDKKHVNNFKNNLKIFQLEPGTIVEAEALPMETCRFWRCPWFLLNELQLDKHLENQGVNKAHQSSENPPEDKDVPNHDGSKTLLRSLRESASASFIDCPHCCHGS